MNMYVLYCEKTLTAAFVDTGATSQEELAPFVDFAAENNLTVTHLLQTHAHIDHIAGLGMAKLIYPDAIVALHVDDTLLYNTAFAQSTFFGVPCPETLPSIDVDLAQCCARSERSNCKRHFARRPPPPVPLPRAPPAMRPSAAIASPSSRSPTRFTR